MEIEEKKEELKEQERGKGFVNRVLKEKNVKTAEWFQYAANSHNSRIIPADLDRRSRIQFCCKALESFPDMCKQYKKKGYDSIVDAVAKDLSTTSRILLKEQLEKILELEERLKKIVNIATATYVVYDSKKDEQ